MMRFLSIENIMLFHKKIINEKRCIVHQVRNN